MKTKPTKHKGKNVFKFQSFSQCIESIDVDIIHKVKHPYEECSEDGDETNFHQCLTKWNDLNLTEAYGKLCEALPNHVRTLPQLLLQKDEIIEILISTLQSKDEVSIPAALDFIVSMAKDLRKEFYEYFFKVTQECVALLEIKNAEIIECSFKCLGYLFKYLWQQIIKNIGPTLQILLPLLSAKKPYYVNNFAAESFAFVARKVKDKKSFLKLIMKCLKNHPEVLNGVGKLLSETIKGVSNQFHSCAESILEIALDLLSDESVAQELLYNVLSSTITEVARFIKNETKTQPLWNPFLKIISKYANQMGNEVENQNLLRILKLAKELLTLRSFSLREPSELITLLEAILNGPDNNEIIGTVCDIIVIVISSQELSVKLRQNPVELMKKVLRRREKNVDEVINIATKLAKCGSLEYVVFCEFVSICEKYFEENNEIPAQFKYFFVNYLKKYFPVFDDEKNRVSDIKPIFELSNGLIQNLYDFITGEFDDTNLENSLISVIILSFAKGDKESLILRVKLFISSICEHIDQHLIGEENVSKFLYALYVSLLFGNAIEPAGNLVDFAKFLQATKKHLSSFDSVCALRALNMCVSLRAEKNNIFSDALINILIKNLGSPYSQVRLISAAILSKIYPDCNLYEVIYLAEKTPATIEEYRKKLQYLQLLECSEDFIVDRTPEILKSIVYFLTGNLFLNFQPVWSPAQKLLATHAFYNSYFWSIFHATLKDAGERKNSRARHEATFLCNALSENYVSLNESRDRPDFENFRILLWDSLAQFGSSKFVKTKDVCVLFLKFIEKECRSYSTEAVQLVNIKKFDSENEEENLDETVTDDQPTENSDFKYSEKLLLAHLKFFSEVKNPKNLYAEKKLTYIYFDLLTLKSWKVQKAALDCVFNYKLKYMIPYKDQLYGLIDEKTFRDNMLNLCLDAENGTIQAEYREDMIKIIMKLIFGKMISTWRKKQQGQHQREMILRFLSGCRDCELMQFVEMIFHGFNEFLKSDIDKISDDAFSNFDVENAISFKRLRSSIDTVMMLLSQCGALLKENGLRYLLRMIFFSAANVSAAINQRHLIHQNYLNLISKLRVLNINALIYFFENFVFYTWADDEVKVLFKVFVTPFVENMNTDCANTITPLFRLFMVWSKNIDYHAFLGRSYDENGNTIMNQLILLLSNDKIDKRVKFAIMDAIDRLLTPEEEEGGQWKKYQYEQTRNEDARVTEGERLIIPHVSIILSQLKRKLKQDGKSNLSARDLNILSRVTQFVPDVDQCNSLVSLLIPVVKKKCDSDDDVIVPLLTSIHTLCKQVSEGETIITNMAPLFDSISSLSARRLLCAILTRIAQKCATNCEEYQLIVDLNAMDKKWVDNPDFNKRLEAISKLQNMAADGALALELAILFVYNCFYMIRTVKDIGLRDHAAFGLRNICPKICLQYASTPKHLDLLLNETLLPLIRDAIGNRTGHAHYEAVLLLGNLARECPNCHFVFGDLKILCDAEAEKDFFENIQHLQLYQKVQAMRKICEEFKKLTTYPRYKTLTQYLLPLVSQFLCSSEYAGKNSLVDSAIDALKIICRLLPWKQYEIILRLYLDKMRQSLEFQKQSVRIVSAILDAYHYDISKASEMTTREVEDNAEVDRHSSDFDRHSSEFDRHSSEFDRHSSEFDRQSEDESGDEMESQKMSSDNSDSKVYVIEKQSILNKSESLRVSRSIKNKLLPKLHRVFSEHTEFGKTYKSNKKQQKYDREEMEMLKIPIALAIAQLLHKLPPPMLQDNISCLFMKLCTYLKSRLRSVRMVARDTIKDILLVVGPKYLPHLLDEMNSLLTRGFQVHVLVFTCHTVLEASKHMFQKGDLDSCLQPLLQICMADLFGKVAEEKEVEKIASKVPEARGNKSYNMLQILAAHVSENYIVNVVLPLKETLFRTLSRKKTAKVSECLRHVVLGLVDNKFISTEALLIFAYGTASQSITELLAKRKDIPTEKEQEIALRTRPDTYIIPEDPKKKTKESYVTCANANAHILVECGLQLLQFMLKRQMLKMAHFRAHLDPFVPVITDCLTSSSNTKMTTLALQCLNWLLKIDLPSLKSRVSKITDLLFSILYKHTGIGLTYGEQLDLILAAFKTVSVLVREVKYHQVNDEQLRALVLYVERDIQDYIRQSTAFTLLKAILSRKHYTPELHQVMNTIANLSITSESQNVRLQARQVFYQYVMDYPMGKNLKIHISFYLSQLSYELQSGRESALEMLQTLIRNLPLELIMEYGAIMFVSLAAQIVNDEDAECRKSAANCVSLIITRLKGTKFGNKLFDITIAWLEDEMIAHRRLAAQLLGFFASVESDDFVKRLPIVIPTLRKQIENMENNCADETTIKDHFIFQATQLFVKIFTTLPFILRDDQLFSDIYYVTQKSQELLKHEHEWVRLSALQIISCVLSSVDACEMAQWVNTRNAESRAKNYFTTNARKKIKSLCLDLCDQLSPENVGVSEKLYAQTMKNLLYLAMVLKDIKIRKNNNNKSKTDDLSLPWLIRRLRKQIGLEVSKYPNSIAIRTMIFNWFAALSLKLDDTEISSILTSVLYPLVREMTIVSNSKIDDGKGGTCSIKNVAKEVAAYYRKKVNQEEYTKVVRRISSHLNLKKGERKKALAQQMITDPERAAKRKIDKQLKKKEQKKRKLMEMRQKGVKRKRSLDVFVEEDGF